VISRRQRLLARLEPLEDSAKILLVGFGLLAVGTGVTAVGWNMYRHSLPGGDVPTFSSWLVNAIGDLLTLTLPGSDLGQQIAAVGVILAAIGSGIAAFGIWLFLAELGHMIDPSNQQGVNW
jgi:hypothetical protein